MVYRNRSKTAHRVDNEDFIVCARNRAYGLDRIENSGGGFAVHHRDVCDCLVANQLFFKGEWVNLACLTCAQDHMINGGVCKHLCHSVAISSVRKDGHLAASGHAGLENSFDSVSAT